MKETFSQAVLLLYVSLSVSRVQRENALAGNAELDLTLIELSHAAANKCCGGF
jgi:hypothetical protein